MAFIKVRKDLIENTEITNGDFRLLCLLIERKGYFSKKFGVSFPCTRDWLAKQLGKSDCSGSISDAIARLEDAGYITVDRKFKQNKRYMLNQKADYVLNTIFSVVAPALIYNERLSDRDFRVLCWLLMYRWELNRDKYVEEIDYKPKEFADALGMSTKTLDRAMKVLGSDKVKYIIFTGKKKFFIQPCLIPFKSKIQKKLLDKDYKEKRLKEHKTGQKYPYIDDEEHCKEIGKWFCVS